MNWLIKSKLLLLSFPFLVSILGCEETLIPKPLGFMRINLKEHEYKSFKNHLFQFELSTQANIEVLSEENGGMRFNVSYPYHKAKIHLAYNPVNKNLSYHLLETRKLTYKHKEKANDIEKEIISFPYNKVYGINYALSGNVASSSQFFITDSTNHFLRGALYFWAKPNEDSLAPVVDYIREDIKHLYENLTWMNGESAQ